MSKYLIDATFVSQGVVVIEADDFDHAVALATDLTSGDFEFPDGTDMNIDCISLVEEEVV